MSESASHLRDVSSTEQKPSPTEQKPSLVGANGVRPPGRRDGPPRSLTEVIVELGLCSREQVLEAIDPVGVGIAGHLGSPGRVLGASGQQDAE